MGEALQDAWLPKACITFRTPPAQPASPPAGGSQARDGGVLGHGGRHPSKLSRNQGSFGSPREDPAAQSFYGPARRDVCPPAGRRLSACRLGEAFTWQDLAAECDRIPLGDLVVQVATPRMLYRMKKDTVRLQDRADAARIREAFNLEDD
jgi:hypothetical protein